MNKGGNGRLKVILQAKLWDNVDTVFIFFCSIYQNQMPVTSSSLAKTKWPSRTTLVLTIFFLFPHMAWVTESSIKPTMVGIRVVIHIYISDDGSVEKLTTCDRSWVDRIPIGWERCCNQILASSSNRQRLYGPLYGPIYDHDIYKRWGCDREKIPINPNHHKRLLVSCPKPILYESLAFSQLPKTHLMY